MRIALATVGTTGDVRPFAALAAALVGRGHDVTAISWELHRPAFEGTGARFEAAGPHTTTADIAATAKRAAAEKSPSAQVAVLRDFHLRDAVAHERQLRELLAGRDLAVIHGIHSLAQAAADDAATRWATVVFDPVLLPTRTAPPAGMPNLGPLNQLAWRLLDRMLRPLDAPLHAALASAGSEARPSLFRGRSPRLHLVACSPSIVGEPADLPATTHVTGYWPAPAGARLDEELAAFLDAGEPPVVISFGSMAGSATVPLHAAASAAARALGRRVVVQGSAAAAKDADGEALTIGEADHRLLFPRAAAVVHHGGAGTTHAVVAAGVPSVVVPHVGDQRYWAQRLRQLGVGARPIPLDDATPDVVRSRLAAALSAPTEAAARALGEQVRAEDGIGTAVSLIEQM
jgi:sterol 3beta-glucosyltransferase/vancomycin aglycone glucosyltransferase